MTKIEKIKENFLKETYQDTWKVYQESLNNCSITKWDWLVLTASNKEQANTYKQEIDDRINKNLLPKETKYLILEDPEGKRVGSGGATLNVLKEIKEKCTDKEFESAKILVIHSGGDSKRIPQYSACGKLFSPVQRELPDGRTSTLFDEFIIAFSAIPERMSPGMIVLSGDVLLVFNPLQIDLHYVDSAAISIKAPVETGCNHGVFLTDEEGNVKKFLHKQTVQRLQELNAVNSNGCIDIDTGAIYFSTKILDKLFGLISTNKKLDEIKCNNFINENSRISFYGDFLYPLAIDSTYDDYLKEAAEGIINEELLSCREIIWKKLNNYNMKVIKLSPAEFIHYGTTKELFNMLTKNINKYKCLNWNKKVLSNIDDDKKYIVNHSYISENTNIEKNVYIENSYIGENVTIGNNVILSNVYIDNETIPDNVCINTILTKNNEYVTRIYAINDNPKVEKSENTPFLNNNLERMINKYNIKESDIWDGEKNIWKAKLYTKEQSNKESIKSALILYKIIKCEASKKEAKNYFNKNRTSLYESFNEADTIKTREKNQKIELILRSYEFINLVKKKESIEKAKEVLLKSLNISEQINNLIDIVKDYDYQVKSRAYLAISKIVKEKNLENKYNENFEDKCYEEIKNAITVSSITNIDKSRVKNKSYVELPIRVNFGGGWSDTPPYCNENGGIVLNGAFKLNGENPIKVEIKKNNISAIILKSIDLKTEKEFTNIEELKDCINTNDPFSLVKASLLVSGIVNKEDKSIKKVIERVGSGFELTTDVTLIPKGSGLGTSSILSGACLKAIYKFLNIKITDEELAYKTLEQEQLMETGGGWQDQIGGIIPGLKCTYTKSGTVQKFNINKIEIDKQFKESINSRFALIYTGQRRLAKNLLRDIMNKYISNDSSTIEIIEKIMIKAVEMEKALECKDLNTFCKLLNDHWELSKKLDDGCTNTCINQILNSCDDLICGKMICGAGRRRILTSSFKRRYIKRRIK